MMVEMSGMIMMIMLMVIKVMIINVGHGDAYDEDGYVQRCGLRALCSGNN